MTWKRLVPHSINSRLEDIKAEKYGPKHITLANSFYAYRRKKKDKLKPKWEGPFVIDKVLTGRAYRLWDA